MKVEADLATGVLASHPVEAARVLERLQAEDATRLLADADASVAANALHAMHAPASTRVLGLLAREQAAAILERMSLDLAATHLRRLASDAHEEVLSHSSPRRARELRALLGFAPDTAGALMDPSVLALPSDLDVGGAQERVRAAADEARYNVYTVDREQRLVGVFTLRELFLAEPRRPVDEISVPSPHRLQANADRRSILTHPGWRSVHALPVVDAQGVYLGAVRYRTLRRLESELGGDDGYDQGATARALGDLFRAGASALLEAVAVSNDARRAGGSGNGA